MAEPAQTQPVNDPEPDIEAALATLPEFSDLFGDKKESGKPAPKEPAQSGDAQESPVVEEESIPGTPAPEPLEDEPVEPEPSETPKEEPAPPERDNVQKRIDKLTAQKKTAEEAATKLEGELAELKSKFATPSIAVTPTRESPLANIFSGEELAKRHEAARTARSWAMRHPNGGEVDMGEGQVKFLTAEE